MSKQIIYPFDTDNFKSKWEIWIEYRKEIKKPYKSDKSIQATFKQLSEYNEEFAVYLIEKSIANGWQGLIFESTKREWLDFYKKNTQNGFNKNDRMGKIADYFAEKGRSGGLSN